MSTDMLFMLIWIWKWFINLFRASFLFHPHSLSQILQSPWQSWIFFAFAIFISIRVYIKWHYEHMFRIALHEHDFVFNEILLGMQLWFEEGCLWFLVTFDTSHPILISCPSFWSKFWTKMNQKIDKNTRRLSHWVFFIFCFKSWLQEAPFVSHKWHEKQLSQAILIQPSKITKTDWKPVQHSSNLSISISSAWFKFDSILPNQLPLEHHQKSTCALFSRKASLVVDVNTFKIVFLSSFVFTLD